jgi:hypothetical protein
MPILLSRRVATILFAFVLMIVQAVCAAQQRPLPSDQWYTVTEHMSPEEYREAYRHNQHLLREQVESYSTDALRSAGVPETGIRTDGRRRRSGG